MKTITFFSEKGGVGKSTMTIMYASWLQSHGVKVAVADYNNRVNSYRKNEMETRKERIKEALNAGKPAPSELNPSKTWPIHTVDPAEILNMKRQGIRCPYSQWFSDRVNKGLSEYDVVLLDFPGSITGGEFGELLATDKLNIIINPIENEQMTVRSTMWLKDVIEQMNNKTTNKTPLYIFINRAQLGLTNMRKIYFEFAKKLCEKGFPLLPDMISYSEKMMDMKKVDIFKSTFGYPDFSKDEYGKAKDLGLGNLFIDVTTLLDRTEDLKDTKPADLSFVKKMKKVNDGRQLDFTPFPELEL